ncbi:anion permease [Simkania negevensis]|uniref:Anion permease n=1 Tax=Simkania negevensis TaxID=83561 RepID=A0ABS3AR61_9BACT|nr:anion permease [Simkania negevensis]
MTKATSEKSSLELSPKKWQGVKPIPLALTFAVGLAIWFSPAPETIPIKGWHLLAIFVATIVGIMSKLLPMGGVAFLSLAVAALTGTLTIKEALSGFGEDVIWLIVIAFFIARSFIKTKLGLRIAYYFLKVFGASTLGIAYALVGCECLLAPFIPSMTARLGGILYPIIQSITLSFDSHPHTPSAKKMGSFLTLVAFQSNAITAAMFLTAMAGNPLIVKLAEGMGITISWGTWAAAAVVPGILSLIIIPYIIYKVSPPQIKVTPNAKKEAKKSLAALGPISFHEQIMVGTLVFLILFWIMGPGIGISSTTTAFVGLSILLVTGVLQWSDIVNEKGAWETFAWFSVLLALASFLKTLGVIDYFSQLTVSNIHGLSWPVAFFALNVIYFFSHYFFASNTAHIGAMYAAFLSVAIILGAPPLLSALSLAFVSNLFGCLTHYATGPAPVLYGAGYVKMREWWLVGLLVGIINIVIWLGVGSLWWKLIGIW